jgi:(1->4)-alpha-D-glucan 1-alpha-D-glucosylmutase
MRVPVATYRVQFNQDFRFQDAIDIVPHLHRLGITHLYASPIWAAREGSTHGYDVIDPNRLNPTLGTREDFDRLVHELRSRDMGLIADIVPNHMAVSGDNAWWMDVLENGADSPYARYFGVNWGAVRHSHGEKIFLPVLGAPYGTALEHREIQLIYTESGFSIRYYSLKLPVAVATYNRVLAPNAESLSDIPKFEALLLAIDRLPPSGATDWQSFESHYRDKESIKRSLWDLYTSEPRVREHIDGNVQRFNGTRGDPRSFDLLDDLLQQQAYRLAFWRVATERINYRRFFDVSDLIGVRVEDPDTFCAYHKLILDLVNEGSVDGLRIDHIDGLADPQGYVERLPLGKTYVVAEKILIGDERLPSEWKLHGTTGYDFLGYMNALFVDPGIR